jgi:probable rRNA maturation factor
MEPPFSMKLLLTSDSYQAPLQLFEVILQRLPQVLPGLPSQQVELWLTDNPSIQALNKQYRGKDAPTDVLSFNWDHPEVLGQLIISVDRAQEQADELGQSLNEELQFLFTHGLLHLLGYDHEDPADEALMLSKAYALLERKNPNL